VEVEAGETLCHNQCTHFLLPLRGKGRKGLWRAAAYGGIGLY
jgi:hypothetical protein